MRLLGDSMTCCIIQASSKETRSRRTAAVLASLALSFGIASEATELAGNVTVRKISRCVQTSPADVASSVVTEAFITPAPYSLPKRVA